MPHFLKDHFHFGSSFHKFHIFLVQSYFYRHNSSVRVHLPSMNFSTLSSQVALFWHLQISPSKIIFLLSLWILFLVNPTDPQSSHLRDSPCSSTRVLINLSPR